MMIVMLAKPETSMWERNSLCDAVAKLSRNELRSHKGSGLQWIIRVKYD